MKNQYEICKIKVVHFYSNDVIRTSNNAPSGGGDDNELPVVPFPAFQEVEFNS